MAAAVALWAIADALRPHVAATAWARASVLIRLKVTS
jgi:hypothetical protein